MRIYIDTASYLFVAWIAFCLVFFLATEDTTVTPLLFLPGFLAWVWYETWTSVERMAPGRWDNDLCIALRERGVNVGRIANWMLFFWFNVPLFMALRLLRRRRLQTAIVPARGQWIVIR